MAGTRQLLIRGVLALMCLAGASSAASADVYWLVTGTFDDNTTLSAKFDVNIYGYLSGWKAKTQQDGVYASELYIPDFNASIDAPPPTRTILFADSYYTSTLQLTFASDLGDPSHSPDLLLGGDYPNTGLSFECQASWGCGSAPPAGSAVRYLTSGVATVVSESVYASAVPEPAAWIMMLLGFGAIGFMLRFARRQLIAFA